MKGIRPHTHQDRTGIVDQLVPILHKKLGDNFVALAADGSYSRHEDGMYSDLELIAFIKDSKGKTIEIRKIIDGMLIVVVSETKESYIKKYLDISDVWYASGAGKLLPIVNKAFIEKVNQYRPEDVEEKCLQQIQKRWTSYQEITAKVLNSIQQSDKELFALSFLGMVKEVLILLSYLNATPYITLGTYISQAKKFKCKPKGFEELVGIYVDGKYQEFSLLEKTTKDVFEDLERLVHAKNIIINSNRL